MDNVLDTLTICCYCVVNSWYTGYIQDRRPGRPITKEVKLMEFILHSKEVGANISSYFYGSKQVTPWASLVPAFILYLHLANPKQWKTASRDLD